MNVQRNVLGPPQSTPTRAICSVMNHVIIMSLSDQNRADIIEAFSSTSRY